MINQQQTEIVKNFLEEAQITNQGLKDDLLDHISCDIELQIEQGVSFEEALQISKEKILPKEPVQVQNDLEFLTTKTQNIMIKKIAYTGGYISALCLCLAILFFSQSLLSEKKTRLKTNALQIENYRANLNLENEAEREDISKALSDLSMNQVLDQSRKFDRAEILLIIAVLTFGLTYLPYRFYSGFKQRELELS